MNAKQRAAEAAMKFIQSGMVVGLGTGSTSEFFHAALARALKEGRLKDITGVPTSQHAEQRARELGIPLANLDQWPRPAVTVDGADEVDPQLRLIKGLGGALLREKLVAQNSDKMVVIVDAGKAVAKLGSKSLLPVEVVPFAYEVHEPFLRSLGAKPTLRHKPDGSIYVTDNGNYIFDCRFEDGINDPARLEVLLHTRAGIVESGLFLNIAAVALIASDDRVEERRRP